MREPALGVVSDRRRLAAAVGVALDEAFDALVAQAAAAARCRVAFYQVREPDLDAAVLLALTRRLAAVAGPMPIFVNDRADVAAAAGVHVHLKTASLPALRVRPWWPAGAAVSRAVHTPGELAMVGPVDFVVAGTVAPTASKGLAAPVLGAEGLAAIVRASPVPVFAIGGLSPADWPSVAATGATGCAAIGAFLPTAGESIAHAMTRATAAFRGVD